MDYNPNGQFNNGINGNNQNFYYQPPLFVPIVPNPEDEERQKDKKILKTLGIVFGVSVILYIVLSDCLVGALLLLAKLFPAVSEILYDPIGTVAISGALSEIVIGGVFLIAYLYLKKKKYTGVLPFGTTYNKNAAISLSMLLAPVVLIVTIIINIVSVLIQTALGVEFESGLENLSAEGPAGAVVLILTLSVLPAIIEEFCIRGVVLQPLRRYGDKFAIVTSAAIFSLLHGNMAQIPYTFTAGILFGYLCVATGSIWPSIVLHFVNNMFSTVQVIISSNFSENAANVSTFVMLGGLIIAGIVGGIMFFKMNYKAELKGGVTTLNLKEKTAAFMKNPAVIIALILTVIMVLIQIDY